jgi:hypothetical protein
MDEFGVGDHLHLEAWELGFAFSALGLVAGRIEV